jgi:hypothetical protein
MDFMFFFSIANQQSPIVAAYLREASLANTALDPITSPNARARDIVIAYLREASSTNTALVLIPIVLGASPPVPAMRQRAGRALAPVALRCEASWL